MKRQSRRWGCNSALSNVVVIDLSVLWGYFHIPCGISFESNWDAQHSALRRATL
jgi:hypothetical protein